MCEYIGHLCYKWLSYYVRMCKDVVLWALHERLPITRYHSVFRVAVGRTQWVVLGARCGAMVYFIWFSPRMSTESDRKIDLSQRVFSTCCKWLVVCLSGASQLRLSVGGPRTVPGIGGLRTDQAAHQK